ncbi:MAG TPA: magnesium/cobalt transporter CorA [Deltaproteobacteria bacterium]|nr:magnesium/cobalt transporter CorA [Deltaproteobacteria bacterium]HQI00426.1 magnesium/cobalt transporter CorA [Deltaproteobacteria bacterium]HQJ07516.1 magnesium/cobalt transporter CorA [Deltaproteobacteria bacterium]
MARFAGKSSKKTGLPPGTLVHIGRTVSEEVTITSLVYDRDHAEDHEVGDIGECFPLPDRQKVTWINVDGLHDVKTIERIGEQFGFHPLFLEDIVNTGTRSKIEDFGEYVFIVMKILYQDEGNDEITAEQISLVLGKNYVVTFQERKGDVFDHVRNLIHSPGGRVRKEGADYLAYLLIDSVVDHGFGFLEHLGDAIEDCEEMLLGKPDRESYQRIHTLKKDALFLRKAVLPMREIVTYLERGESDLIGKSMRIYFKDVYDHTIQIMDTLDTYRDIIGGLLDVYLSSISNRMNEIVKVLTIFATIFIPLTFLAGVYGMNFDYMPELHWHWSYPVFWLVSIAIGLSLLAVFKKKKWI